MKLFFISNLLIFLTIIGCAPTQPSYDPTFLFNHGSCDVYRFIDVKYNSPAYFSSCHIVHTEVVKDIIYDFEVKSDYLDFSSDLDEYTENTENTEEE
jgi:hypothetical protein